MYFWLTRKKPHRYFLFSVGQPFHQKATLTDHVESKGHSFGIEHLYIRAGKQWIIKSYAGTFFRKYIFVHKPNKQIDALFDKYLQ